MLLQSHQDVLHVFANWPKDKDARFNTLRGYGAFLVSAEQQRGTIRNVRVVSERGKPCTLRNPWPGKKVQLIRNGKPAEELDGDLLRVNTGTGEIIEFMPQEAGGVSRPLSR